jgi:hypothetical protein
MKESEDDIEKMFGKRFSQDEAPVSPRVWTNIQKTLPKNNGGVTGTYKRPLLYSLLGSLILGSLLFLFLVNNDINKNTSLADNSSLSEEQNNKTANDKKDKDSTEDNLNNIEGNTDNNKKVKDQFAHQGVKQSTLNDNKKGNKNFYSDKAKTGKGYDEFGKPKNGSVKNNTNNKNDQNGNSNKGETKNSSGYLITANNNSIKDTSVNNNPVNNTSVNNNSSNNNSVNNNSVNNNSSNNNSVNNNSTNNNSVNNNSVNNNSVNNNSVNNNSVNNNSTNNNSTNNNSPSLLASAPVVKDTLEAPARGFDNKGKEEKDKNDLSANMDTSLFAVKSDTSYAINNSIPETLDSLEKSRSIDSVAQVVPDSLEKKKTEKTKNTLASRLSVDVIFGPALTGATTKATDSQYREDVASKNKQDHNRLNFSAGAIVNYSIHPRLYISAGVLYLAYTEKYNFKNSKFSDALLPTGTYHMNPDTIQHFDTIQGQNVIDSIIKIPVADSSLQKLEKKYASKKIDNYSFVSFPINISYYILKRDRFSLLATAGVKVNILLNGVTYIMNQDKTDLVAVRSGFNKLSLSYLASVGMEYKLREHLYLLVQPAVNFNLSSIHQRSFYLSQKPYSFGLNAGLRFRF